MDASFVEAAPYDDFSFIIGANNFTLDPLLAEAGFIIKENSLPS